MSPPAINRIGQGFQLEFCQPDDRSLPAPRGRAPVRRKIDPLEADKLKRILAFGGFPPERSPLLDRLCAQIGILTHDNSTPTGG